MSSLGECGDLDDGGVGEHRAERLEVGERHRVEERAVGAVGDLQQAQPRVEGALADELAVDAEGGRLRPARGRGRQRFRRVHPLDRRPQLRHRGAAS